MHGELKTKNMKIVSLFTIDYKKEGAIYGFKFLEITDYDLNNEWISTRALLGIRISGIENKLTVDFLFLRLILC